MHADADVVVLADAAQRYWLDWAPPRCDTSLILAQQNASSLHWVGNAATSFLTLDVLNDFVSFAKEMYAPMYLPVLEEKHKGSDTWQWRDSPQVSDMTHWYLFALASGFFRDDAKLTARLPPLRKSHRFCNIAEVRGSNAWSRGGWEHQLHGFRLLDNGTAFFTEGSASVEINSIHFQMYEKTQLVKLFGAQCRQCLPTQRASERLRFVIFTNAIYED
eukprot:TRINITY_DN63185_c0_g1_i1.p1 TRINITY_DN63185_c0_g1~~TRINITY_DN63185_c0_g1_i1.p1  ORF type:complete len:218 (-),score=43.10 TRINITY_DN63185_c0_g1_i1:13-666(-)